MGTDSARKFADSVGIKPSTFQSILERGTLSVDNLVRISAEKGVSLSWLATGEDEGASEPATSERSVLLPRYNVHASAGNGTVVLSEDITDFLTVSRSLIERIAPPGARLGIIAATGDSMFPTVQDGDLLIIDFSVGRPHVDAGGVFVVSYAGGLFVKRLQVMVDGTIQIISDNPAYAPERIERDMADELMQVHAQVIWTFAPLRQRQAIA